jgi:predicted RNA-binding Zn ribbon-like protein
LVCAHTSAVGVAATAGTTTGGEVRLKHGRTTSTPATHDVRVVDECLSYDAPVRLRRSEDGLTTRRPRTTREALARLARQAADDLSGPNAERLRTCGDEECSEVFVDPTGRRR